MALAQRLINVQFQLATGQGGQPVNFAESGTNTLTVAGLRVSAQIIKAGGAVPNLMTMQVYGLTRSIMNQLSTLGMKVILVPRNIVTVLAGDVNSGFATVFKGNITNAWADFHGAPNVPLIIEAQAGLGEATIPAKPMSQGGGADAATLMQSIANQVGLQFNNSGVSIQLSNPYLWGSPRSQIQQCAEAAGCAWSIDDGVLVIWPKNGARSGDPVLIAPPRMVGYPSFTPNGLVVKTLFDPSLKLGGRITVQSSIQIGGTSGDPTTSTWAIAALNYDLESLTFDGQWYATMQAINPDYIGPQQQAP